MSEKHISYLEKERSAKQTACERAGGTWQRTQLGGFCTDVRCQRCTRHVAVAELHHNPPKGMGGTRIPYTAGMFKVLCHDCHVDITEHRERG